MYYYSHATVPSGGWILNPLTFTNAYATGRIARHRHARGPTILDIKQSGTALTDCATSELDLTCTHV
jgi:hypothetical protein